MEVKPRRGEREMARKDNRAQERSIKERRFD